MDCINISEYGWLYHCTLPYRGMDKDANFIMAFLKPQNKNYRLDIIKIKKKLPFFKSIYQIDFDTVKEAMDFLSKRYSEERIKWRLDINGKAIRGKKTIWESLIYLFIKKEWL